jgi:type IV secretory pathway VirB2 component (pilin)
MDIGLRLLVGVVAWFVLIFLIMGVFAAFGSAAGIVAILVSPALSLPLVNWMTTV